MLPRTTPSAGRYSEAHASFVNVSYETLELHQQSLGMVFVSSQDCFEESARLPVDNYVQHNIITCTVPSGVGANLSIGIFVGRDEVRMSNLTLFSYDPPRIDFVQPDPVDAKGQEMTIYGANFADANGVRRSVCCGSL